MSQFLSCKMKDSFEEKLMRLINLDLLDFSRTVLMNRLFTRTGSSSWFEGDIRDSNVHRLILFWLMEDLINDLNQRILVSRILTLLPSQLTHDFDLDVSKMTFQRSRHLRIKHDKSVDQFPKLEWMDVKFLQHVCKQELLLIFNEEYSLSCTCKH